MSEALYHDESWLRTQYVEKGKSLKEIADECGVTDNAINTWTKKYDLNPNRPWRDESWLRKQYESGKTGREIAEEAGTSGAIISKWKNRHGIETEKDYRKESWLRKNWREKNLSLEEMTEKSDHDVSIASISGWKNKYDILKKHRDPEWLRTKYDEEGLSVAEMGKIADVDPSTICNSMEKEDISTVSIDERWERYSPPLEGVTGEDHPTYGIRGEDHHAWVDNDYSWRRTSKWKRVKEDVRERDEYTCRRCEEYGKTVHHKEPVSIGGAKFEKDNLEVLCKECHQYIHWHTDLREYRVE